MIGPAVVAQKLPREHHVLGGDRRAVGEMRRRIEREGDVTPRLVGLDGPRQQSIERERFVIAARHQALDHKAADRLHGETLDDERIEAVERAEHALDQPAALWCVGVDIGQRLKSSGRAGAPCIAIAGLAMADLAMADLAMADLATSSDGAIWLGSASAGGARPSSMASIWAPQNAPRIRNPSVRRVASAGKRCTRFGRRSRQCTTLRPRCAHAAFWGTVVDPDPTRADA